MKRTIILVTILFISGLVSAAQKIESFRLYDLDGNLVRLESFLNEGPVVLDFWATWCKPCIKNLKKLEKLHQDYKNKGLTVLGINEDGPRSQAKVRPLITTLGIHFPILMDENRQLVRDYKISAFPTTLLLDHTGKIVQAFRGYRSGDEEKLRQSIEKLLEPEE